MTVHVEGVDAQEVVSKLWRGETSWLKINPCSRNFTREPTAGYEISWRGADESFTRLVGSSAELLVVLRPILAGNDEKVKQFFAEKARKEAQEKALKAASLQQQIESLEKSLEDLG